MFTRIFIVLFCVMAAVPPSIGYGSEGNVRIGYAASNLRDEYQVHLADAVRKAVDEGNAALAIADGRNDPDLQRRQVSGMLKEGVEALIVVAVDAADVDDLIAMGKASGVPLVFMNRNPFVDKRPPENCYFVGPDSFAEGEALLRLAASRIGPRGNVFVLQGLLPSGPAESRTEGIRHALSITYPEMAIVAEQAADWRRDKAREVTENWLAAYGADAFDAILAQNDMMALGALDALEKAGVHDVVVVGIDALPQAVEAIRDGRLAGSVSQDPEIQGRRAVEVALEAVNGGAPALSVIVPSNVVDQKNVSGL